jgi:hypothetical protein
VPLVAVPELLEDDVSEPAKLNFPDCRIFVREHWRHFGGAGEGSAMLMPPAFVAYAEDGEMHMEWFFGDRNDPKSFDVMYSPNMVRDDDPAVRLPWVITTRNGVDEEWWGDDALPNLARLLAEGTAHACEATK